MSYKKNRIKAYILNINDEKYLFDKDREYIKKILKIELQQITSLMLLNLLALDVTLFQL